MPHESTFPPHPQHVVHRAQEVSQLFPVDKERCIGIVSDGSWNVAEFIGDEIRMDKVPPREFKCSNCQALRPPSGHLLFVRSNKSVALLDWNAGKLLGEYMDLSKSMYIGVAAAKPLSFEDGTVISVFRYNSSLSEAHYFFTIDDVIKERRIREVPIPKHIPPLDVLLLDTVVLYSYSWEQFDSPWMALDNQLNETKHDLADILNRCAEDSLFLAGMHNILASDSKEHALVTGYNRQSKKDMLFLATWYDDPKVTPIITDSSLTADGRRLVKTPNQNTMSPSGNWAYFSTDGGRLLPDSHHIIYLDESVPGGYLGPWQLEIMGNIDCASWMVEPEALVVCKEGKLMRFDLSGFDPQQFVSEDD